MGVEYLVVDLDRVMNTSKPGQAALESLRALLKRAEERGVTLKADVAKASDAVALQKAEEALLDHRRTVERELDRRKGALRRALEDLVRKVVRDLAAEHETELVLDAAGVLLSSPDRDMTDEVIRRVDSSPLARR